MMRYTLYRTIEYDEWFENEILKSKFQIKKRLLKIEDEGYFGHIRDLGDGVSELKFNDGRRIYFTIIPHLQVLLLLGGNKNGQDKDIKRAKNLHKKIAAY